MLVFSNSTSNSYFRDLNLGPTESEDEEAQNHDSYLPFCPYFYPDDEGGGFGNTVYRNISAK